MKKRITSIFVLLALLVSIFTLAACGNKDSESNTDETTNPTANQGGIVAPDDVLVLPTGDESNQEPNASETGTTAATTDGTSTDFPVDNSGDSTEAETTGFNGDSAGIELPAVDF